MKEICVHPITARLSASEYEALKAIALANKNNGARRQNVSSLIRAAVRRTYLEISKAE